MDQTSENQTVSIPLQGIISNQSAHTRREVRVFISSTFADMHSERDYLVKVVFPELREQLEPHLKIYKEIGDIESTKALYGEIMTSGNEDIVKIMRKV